MFAYIPLVVGLALSSVLLLPQLSDRAEIVMDGVGQALLGETVSTEERRREQLPEMEAAHIPRSHRSFSSQTVLYSIVAAIAAGLMSLSILWLSLSFLQGLAGSVSVIGRIESLGVFGVWPRVAITLFGSVAATVTVGQSTVS